MFIPFNVLMLPLVNEANKFHIDNVIGITFLYIVFGMPMNTFLYTGYIKSIPEALDEAAVIDGATPDPDLCAYHVSDVKADDGDGCDPVRDVDVE